MQTSTNQCNAKGEKEGYWEEYYDNGKLAHKGSYKDGIYDGYCELYYFDGKPMSKGSYKNREPDGLWLHYNHDGALQQIIFHARIN